ncbi:hypothetical protein TNCT_173431, partial [Trichonephila clavata]
SHCRAITAQSQYVRSICRLVDNDCRVLSSTTEKSCRSHNCIYVIEELKEASRGNISTIIVHYDADGHKADNFMCSAKYHLLWRKRHNFEPTAMTSGVIDRRIKFKKGPFQFLKDHVPVCIS